MKIYFQNQEAKKVLCEQTKMIKVYAIDLLDLEPIHLAKQLTLLQFENFCGIRREELMFQRWTKKKEEAKNVHLCISTFNKLSNWIVSEIVQTAKLTRRTQIMRYFVLVASELEKINNFDTLMVIISALNSAPILRLKKTIEGIPKEERVEKARLQEVMAHSGNYRNYRLAFSKVVRGKPKFPYFALLLSDLTFLDEGNPDTIIGEKSKEGMFMNESESVKLVNIEKRSLMTKTLSILKQSQSSNYRITETIPAVRRWLLELNPVNSDKAYDLSITIEPKNEDETIENFLKQQQELALEQEKLLSILEKLENQVKQLEENNHKLQQQNKSFTESIVAQENELGVNVMRKETHISTKGKNSTSIFRETMRMRNRKTIKPKLQDLFHNDLNNINNEGNKKN